MPDFQLQRPRTTPTWDLLRPLPPLPTVSDNITANRALEETLVSGEGSFQERFENMRQGTGLVYDEALQRILELNTESKLNEIIQNPYIDLYDKVNAMRFEADRIDFKKLSPFDELMFQVLRQEGGAFVPYEKLERLYQTVPASDLRQLSAITRNRQLASLKADVDAVIEANGFDGVVDTVGQVLVQDFIPVYNVLSRIIFGNAMAEAADIELGFWKSLWPGSQRKAMREKFISMSPEEFTDTVSAMKAEVDRLTTESWLAPILTRYAVLEHWQNVFSDQVVAQGGSVDNWDLFFGNFEVAVEATFGTWALAKLPKVTKGAFRKAPGAVSSAHTAVTVRSGEALNRIMDLIRDEVNAIKFQLDSSDTAVATLPKPVQFMDDMDRLPSEIREDVLGRERLRTELLYGNRELLLDPRDQANVVKRELEELARFDGATVYTPMSTVKMLDDGSGVEINAVFGATPERGWDNFEDVLLEALSLDKELRQLDIMFVNDLGKLEKLDISSPEFLRMVEYDEISLSKTGDILGAEEFFLRYRNERPWHPLDGTFWPDSPHLDSSFIRPILTPNAKFSEEFYGAFARSALDEQRIVAILNQMVQPYQQLGAKNKRIANSIFEWQEDFGRVQRRNATYDELTSHWPEAPQEVLRGVVAMRNTMDTMYDMLNQRLYREFLRQGYKTAKPIDPTMATYHGKIATNVADVKAGTFLDPKTGDLVKYSKKDLEDLFASGGTVVEKLPLPVSTNTKNAKTRRVILRGNEYRVRALSEKPLRYHPGYTMRFYDDPYYVVRIRKNATVDGVPDPVGFKEAVRTGGTFDESDLWAKRATRAMQARYGDEADTFEVVRASEIDQGESSLFQKQVMNMEGRLFYDERNFERLHNVNRSRAEIEDPGIGVQRGIYLAARQVTQEDLFRGVKQSWQDEFGRLLEDTENLNLNLPGVNLKQVESELSRRIINATPDVKKRMQDGLEYIKYLRLMEGTADTPVSILRSKLVTFGIGLHRLLGMGDKRNRFFRAWDKMAGQAEPLRLLRSTAFTMFMRLRPFRQYLMQSAQVGFLSGLDPDYILTGRFLKDVYALRIGASNVRLGEIGVTEKAMAKMMGLNINQYRKLAKEFERSGLQDSVDVHSYTGKTALQANPRKLPSSNPIAGAAYSAKNALEGVVNALGQGFRQGEMNNLAGTYMVALRRYMKRNKVDDLMELNPEDWNKIRLDTSNLALAMIKPNNMRYQTGWLSVGTQFLSFQHKAFLAVLGKNPAIRQVDAAKLLTANMTLYGAEFWGASEFVGWLLASNDMDHLSEVEVPGTDTTFENILKYGLIDRAINELGSMTVDDWMELDTSFINPGPNPKRFYEMTLMNIVTSPGVAVFGPTATLAGKTLEAVRTIQEAVYPSDIPTEEKFLLGAKLMAEGAIPVVNDLFDAWDMARYDRMFTSLGEPLPLEPSMNSIMARSTLGIRTRDELYYYQIQDAVWNVEENRRAFIKAHKNHFQKLFVAYYNNEYTPEVMRQQAVVIGNKLKDIPDEYKAEVLQGIFIDNFDDGSGQNLLGMIAEDMSSGNLHPDVFDAIKNMDNIPSDERRLMLNMYQDIWQKNVQSGPVIQEIAEKKGN